MRCAPASGTTTPSATDSSASASPRRRRPPSSVKRRARASVSSSGSVTVFQAGRKVAATSVGDSPGCSSAIACGPCRCVKAMPWSARACQPGCEAASSASLSYRCSTPSLRSMSVAPAAASIASVSPIDRSISAAWAAALAFTRSGKLARQKWNSQGAMRGR